MKKNLKIILSAVLLVAIVAGASVLYQKLGTEYVGDGSNLVGSLITDRDALAAQLGQQNTVNNGDNPTNAPQNSDTPVAPPPSGNTENEGSTEGSEGNNSGDAPSEENTSPDQPPSSDSTENQEENNTPPSPPKNLAPDFTVLDENGKAVKLSDFRGKPVVLNFWATWCGYCMVEMPDFNTVYKKYPEIQFLMVNATSNSDTVEKAKKAKADNGYNFDIFFDTAGEAVNAYNVTGFPSTYFISAEGELIAAKRGMLNMANIEYGVSMILPAKKED